MTHTLITYQNLNVIQKEIFFNFLREATKETTQPAHTNMWDDDWENKNNTLPYLLEKTDRFSKLGQYNVLFDNDNVIACSGVYTSAFCSKLVIAGTRTWINKNYRNQSVARKILLPAEKGWAIENTFKAIAICFNEYNKNLIQVFKRRRLGEQEERINNREPHHLFYNGVNELEFPVTIQYTKQWIMYEKLDPSFDFDWTTIKCKQ
jgi:hypothetical protein